MHNYFVPENNFWSSGTKFHGALFVKINCSLSSDDIVGRGLAPAVQY
jgi:hypothetical protein